MSKKANGKAVEEALALLSTLDDQQAEEVLANMKSPALANALKARKDRESAERKKQEEALNKSMEKIGKILDECKITNSVKFIRSDEGSWTHTLLKKSNGSTGGSKRGAKSGLTDEMRETIDKAIESKVKPDKVDENEKGTVSTFRFKRNGKEALEIPTSWICFHLLESGVGTATDVMKMVGHWGVKGTQARSAENRIHGRK